MRRYAGFFAVVFVVFMFITPNAGAEPAGGCIKTGVLELGSTMYLTTDDSGNVAIAGTASCSYEASCPANAFHDCKLSIDGSVTGVGFMGVEVKAGSTTAFCRSIITCEAPTIEKTLAPGDSLTVTCTGIGQIGVLATINCNAEGTLI